jgi:hypothetical protein
VVAVLDGHGDLGAISIYLCDPRPHASVALQ